MFRSKPWRSLAGVLVVAGASLSIGCQTWLGGMTLPSADYLKDNPDYIPKPPAFPLSKELAAMQADQAEINATQTVPGVRPPR